MFSQRNAKRPLPSLFPHENCIPDNGPSLFPYVRFILAEESGVLTVSFDARASLEARLHFALDLYQARYRGRLPSGFELSPNDQQALSKGKGDSFSFQKMGRDFPVRVSTTLPSNTMRLMPLFNPTDVPGNLPRLQPLQPPHTSRRGDQDHEPISDALARLRQAVDHIEEITPTALLPGLSPS